MIDRWSPWVNAWTGLSLPGVALAVLGWGPVTVLAVAAISAVLGVLALIVVEHGPAGARNRPLGPYAAWAGRVAFCGVVFLVSTLAWTALTPGAALVIVLAGATAPVPTPADPPGGTDARAVDLMTTRRASRLLAEAAHALSDPQLCRAWGRSLVTLRQARSPVERLAVVMQRQSLLDELEARHDPALQDWLAFGTRTSGVPDGFPTGGEGPAGKGSEQ